jgi:hypothetical protein
VSAAGRLLQPVSIILQLKEVPPLASEDVMKFYTFSGNSAGWVTREIFSNIVKNVLIPGIVKLRAELDMPANEPAILFVDGHKAHEDADMLEECKRAHIDVVLLPPHSSHVLQPLDVNFFRSWRSLLKRVQKFNCTIFFANFNTVLPSGAFTYR